MTSGRLTVVSSTSSAWSALSPAAVTMVAGIRLGETTTLRPLVLRLVAARVGARRAAGLAGRVGLGATAGRLALSELCARDAGSSGVPGRGTQVRPGQDGTELGQHRGDRSIDIRRDGAGQAILVFLWCGRLRPPDAQLG